MMVFIFFKNCIYFIAIFVGNRGLQTLMLGLYVLYSAAFSKLVFFVFICFFICSLNVFVDSKDWHWSVARSVEFSPPVALLSIPGRLVGADVIFYCSSSSWQYGSRELLIMHLRELRLLIPRRYLLSPALLSPTPHHTENQVPLTGCCYQAVSSKRVVFPPLVTNQPVGRQCCPSAD